ncbi:hypothetical protein GCM10017778_31220 [Streptomyces vinaceus]|nr:hypothetical protein GCM10017778_31220 [Streptomyces vinaceus]
MISPEGTGPGAGAGAGDSVLATQLCGGQHEARPDPRSPLDGQAGEESVRDAACLARSGGQGVAGGGTSVGVRIVEERKDQVDIGGYGVA